MQVRMVVVATVLMVAVASGCGSGRGGPAAARPTTTDSTIAPPGPVIAAARDFAESGGDPHPALPVLWVATTRTNVVTEPAAAESGVSHPNQPNDPGWLIQIRGDFSGCPCKGGAHGPGKEFLVFLPMAPDVGTSWSFGDQIHDLSPLGPLHSFNL